MRDVEFTARGLTFTGVAAGPDDGEPVVLLHGLPRTSWEWHHQVPALAAAGWRVLAPDLRGSCPGARPDGVDAYHLDEFVADVLAVVDTTVSPGAPFHVVGTSSGAFVAWRLAARRRGRIRTVAALNIPHQGALIDVQSRDDAVGEEQRRRLGYFEFARTPGNERLIFDEAMRRMDLPDDELDPYRRAFADDHALRAVFDFYRAMPQWADEPLEAVSMPALFVWPTEWGNISLDTARACADWATGPYRFEAVDSGQPITQTAPDQVTRLLLDHLTGTT